MASPDRTALLARPQWRAVALGCRGAEKTVTELRRALGLEDSHLRYIAGKLNQAGLLMQTAQQPKRYVYNESFADLLDREPSALSQGERIFVVPARAIATAMRILTRSPIRNRVAWSVRFSDSSVGMMIGFGPSVDHDPLDELLAQLQQQDADCALLAVEWRRSPQETLEYAGRLSHAGLDESLSPERLPPPQGQ